MSNDSGMLHDIAQMLWAGGMSYTLRQHAEDASSFSAMLPSNVARCTTQK